MIPSNRLVKVEVWPKQELERLITIVKRNKKSGVMILSGDVHHAQFLSSNCDIFGYPLLELSTSGLTHTCDKNIFG